ncbi:uncharacterized protein HMPREF1541_06758 [Cyphellophora europaea CBS 101466]|uniref:C2H2-type domain-containing protein n=1 Tax=Cyphellophora europaea (strain CBS 101466) TaxID=1220924 RepID=W2RQW7_CYPE1|nr:uncharacterized protein HMPREF1541_06758 [Cyphellophora europaea CBS 101466]ETN38720.1 hypothetical protein HMPREF1541_06758 [Cyphellophora europaea CBS 101466]
MESPTGAAHEDVLQRPQEQPPKKPKRFQCHRCQRMFARLEHLQRHERTHTQEKPFACQLCDQRFSRSDLLVRHERLNHDSDKAVPNGDVSNSNGASNTFPNKRRRSTMESNVGLPQPQPAQQPLMSPSYHPYNHAQPTPSDVNHGHQEMPFATLLMAAEQAHPAQLPPTLTSHPSQLQVQEGAYQQQPAMLPPPPQQQAQPQPPMQAPGDSILPQPFSGVYDFEDSLNDLANFIHNDNGPLATYHFSSFINSEQPIPFFSPESFTHQGEVMPSTEPVERAAHGAAPDTHDDHGSFSRYGSRLPSLQPEDGANNEKHLKDDLASGSRSIADVTQDDRQKLSTKLEEFSPILPPHFQLPTRLALSRYVAGYINGFQEHLPFLHVPTMNVDNCCIELFLAMAAVGAQYCFEGEKGVELFTISQNIAIQRIKQRDNRLAAFHKHVESQNGGSNGYPRSQMGETPRSTSISGPLGLPSQSEDAGPLLQREDLIQTAQALLLLMAMATWAKHREILREALAIQSVLATLVRDDGLRFNEPPPDVEWSVWARHESCKRTKFVVYCFFNLHCIVYNIPALILNSELDMTLPCNAAEFKAPSESKWREARARSTVPEMRFQDALSRLFSRGSGYDVAYNSSLANYILVHALIQHIFFVRQVSRYRLYNSGELATEDVTAIEHALRNWQLAWKRNPESSLDPMNPNGPLTFNSTALLRLAYIRLNVDIGPGRALDTRDPLQIARAFHDSPALNRTPKLLRAVLHSAHALSIPIKIGIHLVAQTQTFNWSIQHSLCTLECAYLLSKWLEALSAPNVTATLSSDERKIASLVKTMLDETEFAVPSDVSVDSPAAMKYLSASVLRVWARVFRGSQTWAIVDIIGGALDM